MPNNSILQNQIYCINKYKNIKDKNISFLRLLKGKNKNVKQPAYLSPLDRDYILIIAQVKNDFSIFSPKNIYKNTIKFYLDLVNKLLKHTKYNIIIKTHPYEIKKVSNLSETTFFILNRELKYVDNANKRVKIIDNFSINSLIDNALMVITLNSQSGLQAAHRFKPIVCFGEAFYSHKGFTYDYTNIDEFINNIHNIKYSLDNYLNYCKFIDVCFEHLIGIGDEDKLKSILEKIIILNKKNNITLKTAPKIILNKEKTKISTKQILTKKIKKFFRSPIEFFVDSKIFLLIKRNTIKK